MYAKPDAPLGMGGVLDDGFKLFKSALGPLYGLAFLASLAQEMPGMIMASSIDNETLRQPSIGFGLGAAGFVAMILYLILFAALLARIDAVANNLPSSFGQALKTGLRRGGPLFLMSFCAMLAVAGGLILLIIPGLILMVSLFMGPFLVVSEGKGPIASLRESHKMVWGNWWRTATLLTVAFVVALVFLMAASFVAGLLMIPFVGDQSAGTGFGSLLIFSDIVNALIAALFLPLVYCLLYSIYQDLKLRREGADLLGRLEAAGS